MRSDKIKEFLEDIENPVQKDYCEQILKIWDGQTDDWYDQNNFNFALVLLLGFCYSQFSASNEEIFSRIEENRDLIVKQANRVFV